MKCFYIFSVALLMAVKSLAGSVSQQPGESDQKFVERVTEQKVHSSDGTHPQLDRNSKVVKGSDALIAFTNASNDGDFDIQLNVLIKKSATQYDYLEPVLACEIEGGSPTLTTFFYVNIKGESNPVIAVICSWPPHRMADCQLNNEVRFFKVTDQSLEIVDMEKYKNLFYKDEKPDPKSKFTCSYSKFKTAQDVKTILLKSK